METRIEIAWIEETEEKNKKEEKGESDLSSFL